MKKNSNENNPSLVKPEHEALLSQTPLATLSTIRKKDGYITTNPVSYIWNGEEIEISTLKHRMKYKNLLANPLATVCIVSPNDPMKYVEIRGQVRFVDDPEREYVRQAFKKISGVDMPEDMDPPNAERVTLYLRPEQVSSPVLYGGRFDKT